MKDLTPVSRCLHDSELKLEYFKTL